MRVRGEGRRRRTERGRGSEMGRGGERERDPARRQRRETVPEPHDPAGGDSPYSGLPGSPLIEGASCPQTVVFKPQGRVQTAERK